MFRILHNLISQFPSSVFVASYLAPVDADLMCFFNHILLTPTVFFFCTHLYLVPFLLEICCQQMLLMRLLYLHLHCIHALKFCK